MIKELGKVFELKPSRRFFIPIEYRRKFNWIPGDTVSLALKKKSLVIHNKQKETDIICVIGRGGSILIPSEVISFFELKKMHFFKVKIDEEHQELILVPLSFHDV